MLTAVEQMLRTRSVANWPAGGVRAPQVGVSIARNPALDGLRALLALWVMALHLLFFLPLYDASAFADIVGNTGSALAQWGFIAVDGFFVMSGLLIGLMLIGEIDRTGRLDLRRFYLGRATRLLPPLALAGALWLPLGISDTGNWWTHFLFVSTFVPVAEQFMVWAWFVSVIAQFYLLAPLLVWLGLKAGRHVFALIALVLAAGIAVRLAVVPPNIVYYPSLTLYSEPHRFAPYFDLAYGNLPMRFGALAVGLGLAFVVLRSDVLARIERSVRLRRTLLVLPALVFLPMMFVPPPNGHYAQDRLAVLAGIGAGHTLAAIAFACLIALVITPSGRASRLGRVLSLRVWQPISASSYSFYLLHPLVICVALDFAGAPFESISAGEALLFMTAVAAVSLALAMFATLALGRPLTALLRARTA